MNTLFNELQNISLADAFIVDTNIPGKNLCIFVCVHGNEIVGLKATERFMKEYTRGEISLTSGSITFILGNKAALVENKRFIEKNMNRAFTIQEWREGNIKTDKETQRAKEIWEYIATQKMDYVLDLHSVSVGDVQMAVIGDLMSKENILQRTDVSMIISGPHKMAYGSTLQIAKELGIEGICIECGNHRSPFAEDIAMKHIMITLAYLTMIDAHHLQKEKRETKKEIAYYSIQEKIVPAVGFSFIDSAIATDSVVKKGEVYAICDMREHTASSDYVVLMPDRNPSPHDSDAGFLTYKEIWK